MQRRNDACHAGETYETALATISEYGRPLGPATRSLVQAGGLVLAEAIVAGIASPRFDCAAMDGYAVAGEVDGFLRCRGSVRAGDPSPGQIRPGEAMRVMTGAPVPQGTERVVMLEYCRVSGDRLEISGNPGSKLHMRPKGSDFRCGETLLPVGRILDPQALLVAGAADAGLVTVWRPPSVVVLTTGDEIIAAGQAADNPWSVPDSLGPAIVSFCRQWGADTVRLEQCSDDRIGIRASADREPADVVVLVGGASRGDRDFSRTALMPLGLQMLFADIAMKPGKPVWLGRVGSSFVLGLPGNPTAALTTARLLLAPLLAGLSGRGVDSVLAWETLAAATPIPANGPRESFLCAALEEGRVRVIDRQQASSQAMLAGATHLVRRASSAPAVDRGTPIAALAI